MRDGFFLCLYKFNTAFLESFKLLLVIVLVRN